MPVLYDDGKGGQAYLCPSTSPYKTVKDYTDSMLLVANAEADAVYAAINRQNPDTVQTAESLQ